MRNTFAILTLIISACIALTASAQVDSSFTYIAHLTINTDSLSESPIKLAIASDSDTLVFKNQNDFRPIGLPKTKKIDILIFIESNIIKISDITSMMTFELWHYLNISLSDPNQSCMLATFWNENGEQISNNQIDEYLDDECKMIEGVSCHYSEIGSYHLQEYSNSPPDFMLFGK